MVSGTACWVSLDYRLQNPGGEVPSIKAAPTSLYLLLPNGEERDGINGGIAGADRFIDVIPVDYLSGVDVSLIKLHDAHFRGQVFENGGERYGKDLIIWDVAPEGIVNIH